MASVFVFCIIIIMCRFTPQNWQPETTFQRVVTTACSPPHHVRFTDLWTRCSPYRWQAMPSLPSSSRGAEASHMTRRERRGADSGDASPEAEAHTPQRHPAEISLAKRRNAVSTPLRHIHRHIHRHLHLLIGGLLPLLDVTYNLFQLWL